MSHAPTYAGHDVRLVIHAHVMAEDLDAALRHVIDGLRKQTHVQLTTITPVGEVPATDDPDAPATYATPDVTGVYTPKGVWAGETPLPGRADLSHAEVVAHQKRNKREKRKGALRHRLCENHTVMLEWDECSPGFIGCTHKRKRAELTQPASV